MHYTEARCKENIIETFLTVSFPQKYVYKPAYHDLFNIWTNMNRHVTIFDRLLHPYLRMIFEGSCDTEDWSKGC